MNTASGNFWAPYGAHQLKATYQRNMLAALGTTTALVALGVTAGVLLGPTEAPAAPPMPPKPETNTIEVTLTELHVPGPQGPTVTPQPPDPVGNDGGMPTPVPDDRVNPQNDTAVIHDPGGGPGVGLDTGEFQEGWGGGTGEVEEPLPPRGGFVWAEKQPELVYSVEPEYPRWVKDVGIEGVVVITALVGPKGDVLDAAVYVSSGNKLLDEAALAVAGKYKYTPAVQNGRPVAIWVTYKVVFSLAQN